MRESFDGLSVARRRIAEEAERRTGFLDLSQLGLTELPDELFRLPHLRRLHLGYRLRQVDADWVLDYADNQERLHNQLGCHLDRLSVLSNLEALSLSRTDCSSLDFAKRLSRLTWLDCRNTLVTDLGPLAQLQALQSLNCSFTRVSDLGPLVHLQALQSLDCHITSVSDLGPLARLQALQSLDCSNSRVADLGPLAQLQALQSLDCRYTQVSDLGPLAQLQALQSLRCGSTQLQSLDCGSAQLSDLGPLAELQALQSLDCRYTQVADLGPLARLLALQSLDCTGTQVSDLGPLARLRALQSLGCSSTQVSDLGPLAQLQALQSLGCSLTRVSDLGPLAQLRAMQSLDFSTTQVSDLGPLAQLQALQSLDCSETRVADLGPLAQLQALQSLNCSRTQVAELGPLAQLRALQSLDCSVTKVSDLGPLAQLQALQSLTCWGTQVSDLGPLAQLQALQSLDCSECHLSNLPEQLLRKPSMTKLVLFRSQVPGVPGEVLSQGYDENCLESLRAHFQDLSVGPEAVTDVKLLILGNGRAGKTQLSRRLRNAPFQQQWDSTHGIRITCAPLPLSDGNTTIRLNIWDFGGQDIYHGTHALFVRTRAVFLLAWAKDTEAASEYEHGGIRFRNHPLLYWVEYVRHLAEAASPVLIVQTKCDARTDEIPRSPVPDEVLKALGYPRELHFSANNDRGLDVLKAELREAIGWLWEKQGVASIGAGRLRMQRRLEALRNADGTLPPEYRLLDQATFRAWCDEAGGVTSPEHLLAYLHNAGIVFYEKGLFGDQIVLDHAWALNAIYAVFDRVNCYKRLRKEGGRFDRPRLDELVWKTQGHSEADQRLLLSLMRSCGICFVYRQGRLGIEDDDTIYVAPDLLPDRAAVQTDIDRSWDFDLSTESVTFKYPLLHSGLMRALIARIGDKAGIDAVYWLGGVCAYESTTHSRALIEQTIPPGDWRGTILLQTKGGQAADLLTRLAAWITEEGERLGLRPTVIRSLPPAPHPTQSPLSFGRNPTMHPTYAVSYAWNDTAPDGSDREEIVNRLCTEAEARGIHIVRDKDDMRLGDRISEFTRRLAQCERVFVVISEKYLRSGYCMSELYEIWLKCQSNEANFVARVRAFTLPDARISDIFERSEHVAWWQDRHARVKALVDKHGQDFLSQSDYDEFRRMGHFVRHVPDILSLMQDTLRPRNFDELARHGFDDTGKPSAT
jgi:internalin A